MDATFENVNDPYTIINKGFGFCGLANIIRGFSRCFTVLH